MQEIICTSKNMKRKIEKKAFLLFTDRLEKMEMQYFVDIHREQPTCYWWYKGLTEQQVLEQGCCITVAELDSLWNYAYWILKKTKIPAKQ